MERGAHDSKEVEVRVVLWPDGHDSIGLQGLPHMGRIDRETYDSLRARGVISDETDHVLQRNIRFKQSYQAPMLWTGSLVTAALARYLPRRRWSPWRIFGISMLGGIAFGMLGTAAYMNEAFTTLRMLDERGKRALEELGKAQTRKFVELSKQDKIMQSSPSQLEPAWKDDNAPEWQAGEYSGVKVRDGKGRGDDSAVRDWPPRSTWDNVRQRQDPGPTGSVDPNPPSKAPPRSARSSNPDVYVDNGGRSEEQRRFDELLEKERRLGQDDSNNSHGGSW